MTFLHMLPLEVPRSARTEKLRDLYSKSVSNSVIKSVSLVMGKPTHFLILQPQ